MLYSLNKIFLDYLISLILLILLFPLFIFISLCVKIESKGTIFYLGERVGKDLKTFKIIKFRTMVEDAEVLGGLVTSHEDMRITRVGKFLRKYKLDELPQFINILRAEMSLVGPRPEAYEFVDLYSKEDKELVYSVKPGITDYSSIEFIQLGQVLGLNNNHAKFQDEVNKVLEKKLKLRKQYVLERSFLKDLHILFLTFLKLVRFK